MCTLVSTAPKAQNTISSVLTEKGEGGSGRAAEGLWGRYPQSFLSAVLLPPPAATPIDKLFSLSFYTFACSPPTAGRSAPCYLRCDPQASVLRALPQHWLPEPLHPAASSSSQSLSATALASTQKWSPVCSEPGTAS